LALSAVFATSFIVALSGALMPGPLLTVTIAQTAKRGFAASLFLVIGHSLLELVAIVGLILGLGHFLRLRPVIGTVAVLGGVMLLMMGWTMVRDARRGVLDIPRPGKQTRTESKERRFLDHPVFTGVAVSATNPYWVIWWATIGLAGVTFFGAAKTNAIGALAAFYTGHIAGDFVWYLAVGAAVAGGRKLMSDTAYRLIVQACAIFLAFLGGTFIYLVATGSLWKINMALDWGKI